MTTNIPIPAATKSDLTNESQWEEAVFECPCEVSAITFWIIKNIKSDRNFISITHMTMSMTAFSVILRVQLHWKQFHKCYMNKCSSCKTFKPISTDPLPHVIFYPIDLQRNWFIQFSKHNNTIVAKIIPAGMVADKKIDEVQAYFLDALCLASCTP